MTHTFNPSTAEAEAEGSLVLKNKTLGKRVSFLWGARMAQNFLRDPDERTEGT